MATLASSTVRYVFCRNAQDAEVGRWNRKTGCRISVALRAIAAGAFRICVDDIQGRHLCVVGSCVANIALNTCRIRNVISWFVYSCKGCGATVALRAIAATWMEFISNSKGTPALNWTRLESLVLGTRSTQYCAWRNLVSTRSHPHPHRSSVVAGVATAADTGVDLSASWQRSKECSGTRCCLSRIGRDQTRGRIGVAAIAVGIVGRRDV